MHISNLSAIKLDNAFHQPSRHQEAPISESNRKSKLKSSISSISVRFAESLSEDSYNIKDLLAQQSAHEIGMLAEAATLLGFSFCGYGKKNIATDFVKKAEDSGDSKVVEQTINAIRLSIWNTNPVKGKPPRPIQS